MIPRISQHLRYAAPPVASYSSFSSAGYDTLDVYSWCRCNTLHGLSYPYSEVVKLHLVLTFCVDVGVPRAVRAVRQVVREVFSLTATRTGPSGQLRAESGPAAEVSMIFLSLEIVSRKRPLQLRKKRQA